MTTLYDAMLLRGYDGKPSQYADDPAAEILNDEDFIIKYGLEAYGISVS